MKTTNYYSTFIEIAEDCPAEAAERDRGKTAVRIQYEMISNHPYMYTSDDVLFNVFAVKHDLSPKQNPVRRKHFSQRDGPVCDHRRSANYTDGVSISMPMERPLFMLWNQMNIPGLQTIKT